MPRSVDLSRLSASELLGLHARLSAELQSRDICRSNNNPVADHAENLVAKAMKLNLANKSTAGFDATDPNGRRYEIKARRDTPTGRTTRLGAIRGINRRHFDFLVAVIFNEDYTVKRAVRIPYGSAVKIARRSDHVNGHFIMLRDLWNADDALDITLTIRKAEY